MEDMVRAQFRLLDSLGVKKLYASVGSSMGGMRNRSPPAFSSPTGSVGSSPSAAARRSHPYSIAMRAHAEGQVLMMDPELEQGSIFYGKVPPHAGMKLAREIATVTYRSGPGVGAQVLDAASRIRASLPALSLTS